MKASLFLVLILFSQLLVAQITYYKLQSIELENTLEDLEFDDNQIFISALGLVKTDTNLYSLITNLSKINLIDGKEIKTISKSNLLPFYFDKNSFNRLSKFRSNFIVSGHETSITKETKFHILNPDLEDQIEFSILSANADRIGNEGILVEDSILYSYGLLQKDAVLYANVVKYNLNSNTIIWDKNYKKGKRLNEMWDFQKTRDGNFIFTMYHKDADAGSGSNSGYQITKIDKNGSIMDTFNYKDSSIDKQRILASREGPIYFTTEDNLLAPIIPTNGRINKLSEDMDTILWSLELPSNAFTDGNMYEIFDYIQASNGDILACGKVWHMPGGPLVAGPNASYNGFVARATQQGDLKWSRIYRLPNDNPKLPNDTYGNFRAGQLDKILETETGNFVLGGTAYYTSLQRNSGKIKLGDTLSSLWILVVNENGCIEGEECEEVIHLDKTQKETKTNLKYVSSDNIWNVGDYFEKPFRFTFSSDSTLINDKYYFQKRFSISEVGSFDGLGNYYREENGIVYELDPIQNKERIVFNFNLKVGDSIQVNNPEIEMKMMKVVHIDSITFYDNKPRKRIRLECKYGDQFEWIEGFGDKYLIFAYCFVDDISDGNITCYYTNGTLVFENDFDLPCWYLGVGTEETKTSKISIYPNPAKENLIIKSDNTISQIKIYNIDGKLNGEYKTSEISLENYEKGIYIIEVIDIHNIKSVSKFIKK